MEDHLLSKQSSLMGTSTRRLPVCTPQSRQKHVWYTPADSGVSGRLLPAAGVVVVVVVAVVADAFAAAVLGPLVRALPFSPDALLVFAAVVDVDATEAEDASLFSRSRPSSSPAPPPPLRLFCPRLRVHPEAADPLRDAVAAADGRRGFVKVSCYVVWRDGRRAWRDRGLDYKTS